MNRVGNFQFPYLGKFGFPLTRFPWLTRFMRFKPMTFIRWLQAKGRKRHADKSAEGEAAARGRPPTPQFIVGAILAIRRDNLRYSAGHIA